MSFNPCHPLKVPLPHIIVLDLRYSEHTLEGQIQSTTVFFLFDGNVEMLGLLAAHVFETDEAFELHTSSGCIY